MIYNQTWSDTASLRGARDEDLRDRPREEHLARRARSHAKIPA